MLKLAPLKISQLRCTAAQATTLTYPRDLASLCIALDTPIKKDTVGKKVMLKLSKPKPRKPDEWFDDIEDFKILIEYNRDDVRAEEAASKMLPELTPIELEIFHLIIRMNGRGLKIDLELARNAWSFVCKMVNDKKAELSQLTNGEVTKGTQGARILKQLALNGLHLQNMQAETVEDTLKRKDLTPTARRLLELRQLLSKSSTAKYKTMIDAVCLDGRVRGCQMFYAATTGRMGGRGMQPHNFVKSSSELIPDILDALKMGDYEFFKALHPDVQSALSICLRSMIIPEKGKTFFDLDWNAIEARVILWLAGDVDGLQTYIDGRDPYTELVALVLDMPIEEVTKDQRQYLGKPGVLGSGFGMGWEKFAAKENMDPVLAHKTIKEWRKLHKPVKDFWKILINAAVEAVENRGKVIRAGAHIQYKYDGKKLICRLPSGRCLYYQGPEVQTVWKTIVIKTPVKCENDGKTRIFKEEKKIPQKLLTYITYKGSFGFRTKTYGGHQAENVTQATARDIVFRALLRTDKAFPFVLSIHDEGLAEIDKGADPNKFIRLMSATEAFTKGLPLKTEFWQNKRFGSY